MNWYAADRRIDTGVSNALSWWPDADGNLRAVIARSGNGVDLMFGSNGTFQTVRHVDSDKEFLPLGLSPDAKSIYGLSEAGRQQRDMVALDTATHAMTTVFTRPGVDVAGAAYDDRGAVVGAKYFRDGAPVIEYFDASDRTVAERVAKDFPGSNVRLLDRDATARRFLVAVDRSDQPARYYEVDLDTPVVRQFDDVAPDLAGRLSPTRTVHAAAADGTTIEAYLTMPLHASGHVPLVVYAHGGPIGIRDTLSYDPAVQLFASLGYAVLQVNFRGSEGYGSAFRNAAMRRYGSLIEDDIDAATRKVLSEEPIDAARICTVGASYGGYSALVSAIRWPRRIRCAVSISGVSDQTLMFTASDFGFTAQGRKVLETQIGNPATDAETLRKYSPLYRYTELEAPVMLVHGTEDTRVDYEHTRRLARMLALAGRPPVLLTLEGEGHGGFTQDDETRLWKGVAGFLRQYLDAPAAPPNPAQAGRP